MSRDIDGALKSIAGPMVGHPGWRSRDGYSVREQGVDVQVVALWDDEIPTAGVIDHVAETIGLGDSLVKAYVVARGELVRVGIFLRTVTHRVGDDAPMTHGLALIRHVRGDAGTDAAVLVAEVRWMTSHPDAHWTWEEIFAANADLNRWSAGLT